MREPAEGIPEADLKLHHYRGKESPGGKEESGDDGWLCGERRKKNDNNAGKRNGQVGPEAGQGKLTKKIPNSIGGSTARVNGEKEKARLADVRRVFELYGVDATDRRRSEKLETERCCERVQEEALVYAIKREGAREEEIREGFHTFRQFSVTSS